MGGTLHYNSQAALFGQSVREMRKLLALVGGGDDNIVYGAGDLYVTVFGGRTRLIGTLLGRGMSFPEAMEELDGITLESIVIATRTGARCSTDRAGRRPAQGGFSADAACGRHHQQRGKKWRFHGAALRWKRSYEKKYRYHQSRSGIFVDVHVFVCADAARIRDVAGGDGGGLGAIGGAYGVMQIALRVPLGIISDKIGKDKFLLLIGFVILAVSGLMFIVAKDTFWVMMARGVGGAAAAWWVVICASYSKYNEEDKQVKAQGLLNASSNMGKVVAALAGGLLAQAFGLHAPLLFRVSGRARGHRLHHDVQNAEGGTEDRSAGRKGACGPDEK